MALPTLVNVTPVPGNISKGEVCAAPIWILFAIVVAIPTTDTVVIAAPTDTESPIATPAILLIVNSRYSQKNNYPLNYQ